MGKKKSSLIKKWIDDSKSNSICTVVKKDRNSIEEFIQDFDALIVTDIYDIDYLQKIDRLCKEKDKKFIYCGCIGSFGFFFNMF